MPAPRDFLLPVELAEFLFSDDDDNERMPAVFLYTVWPILLVLIYPTLCLIFLIEGIVELAFLGWLRARKLWRQRPFPSELTPLLSRENPDIEGLLENGSRAYGGDVAVEYPAVDIAAVDLSTLKDGARIHALPTRLVQLPIDDVSQVAVLSWRWDFLHSASTDPSSNVAHAITYAKSRGIRYIFIDIISLDQTLPPEKLIPQVARFGQLYGTIPVIAAYDDRRLDFRYTMLRPWICSEIKSMFHNPHKIVYVGHLRQGTHIPRSVLHWWLGRVPRSRMTDTHFAEQLQNSISLGFVTSVLELLNGHTSMADIHDFKYIVPSLTEIFIAAEHLPPNDYLLTVALMLASPYGSAKRYVVEGTFLALTYTKFVVKSPVTDRARNITTRDNYTVKHVQHDELHEICIGENKIASLSYHHERWKKTVTPTYTITFSRNIPWHILKMLGLELNVYSRCLKRGGATWTYLEDEAVQNLNLEVVEQKT